MCAFNAALNFGKDMIELSVSTLATLVSVQLADLTTFLKRQSDAIARTGDVRDVAAFMALQREYREAFWTDRRKTLAATTGALQVASRRAAKSWAEWVRERDSPAASIESEAGERAVTRDPVAIEPRAPTQMHPCQRRREVLTPIEDPPQSCRSKIADGAIAQPTKASVGNAVDKVRKRSVKTRHPPPTTH